MRDGLNHFEYLFLFPYSFAYFYLCRQDKIFTPFDVDKSGMPVCQMDDNLSVMSSCTWKLGPIVLSGNSIKIMFIY